MVKRRLEGELKKLVKQFPVVAIFGPRQSGKTTLSKMAFKNYKYINLENVGLRRIAKADPMTFLETYSNERGIILDEVQNVPDLLSYIQVYVDEHEKPGFFVLTGSQNLLLNQSVSQTLAGRVAILTLLPFSTQEIEKEGVLSVSHIKAMYKGLYPRVLVQKISPLTWYPNYLQTYVERDVRLIKNVTNLSQFQHFIELCAGRIGQLLNLSSLGSDCGISTSTARSWLSVLESSYIVFLLRPHHKNFSKRIVKAPKLYFYDTGLACSLLGIQSEQQLLNHYLRGGLFESFVIAEYMKHYYNRGQIPRLYFWRDNHGHEVDCIIDRGDNLIPVEIKAGKTIAPSFFKELEFWNGIAGADPLRSYLVYGGNEPQRFKKINAVGWQSMNAVFSEKNKSGFITA